MVRRRPLARASGGRGVRFAHDADAASRRGACARGEFLRGPRARDRAEAPPLRQDPAARGRPLVREGRRPRHDGVLAPERRPLRPVPGPARGGRPDRGRRARPGGTRRRHAAGRAGARRRPRGPLVRHGRPLGLRRQRPLRAQLGRARAGQGEAPLQVPVRLALRDVRRRRLPQRRGGALTVPPERRARRAEQGHREDVALPARARARVARRGPSRTRRTSSRRRASSPPTA